MGDAVSAHSPPPHRAGGAASWIRRLYWRIVQDRGPDGSFGHDPFGDATDRDLYEPGKMTWLRDISIALGVMTVYLAIFYYLDSDLPTKFGIH
ncbi:hypothetical protein [Sphingomonas arenae]|nr:hypothetical protein [Sphingomonas arenae]